MGPASKVQIPVPKSGGLHGGFASVNITPPLGISIEGYVALDRYASGIADDLFARAIVLDDGVTRLAVVSCDVLGLERETVLTTRKEIEATTGILPEAVLISCTHNRTGPQCLDLYRPKDQSYLDQLIKKVVSVVRLANDNLTPISVGLGTGQEPSLCHNRRVILKDGRAYFPTFVTNPDDVVAVEGPTDPTVGVIACRDEQGALRGLIVNYATHVDVVTGDRLSADYSGVMVDVLRKAYDPNLVVLFTAGACADVDPIGYRDPRLLTRLHYHDPEGPAKAKQIGTILAAEVLKVLAGMAYEPTVILGAKSRCINIPTRRPTVEQIREAESVLAGEVADAPRAGSHGASKISAEEWNTRARNLAQATLRFADFQSKHPTLPVEIQALRIGKAVLIGIPAELFAALGQQIISAIPAVRCFVVTYSNGYLGYIPTPVAYEHGGYETIPGWANQLEPEAGQRIVAEAVASTRDLISGG